MSTTRDQERAHGSEVAVELGWPRDRVGLIGAFGGLLKGISEPLQKPRPAIALVRRYRAESDAAVRLAVAEALLDAVNKSKDGSVTLHVKLDAKGRIRVSPDERRF